ncbi:uncharacterized protein LOC121812856 [Haplochromis burtoni]|uniref:uncharacterized protein LOC121812856 n=1 Tax=Haplochromis burtoni TaxID=8153 RepID=UPI001C2DA34F|nr:uncharacterized protein LOC121812856 [Haplochromis burtoni]
MTLLHVTAQHSHHCSIIIHRNQPGPPPICVSLKSDASKNEAVRFKVQPVSAAERIHTTPAGPEPDPSCVSLNSGWSADRPINFKFEQASVAERLDQESSEVPSDQSAQKHQTHMDSIFMLLEDNIITFVKDELKKIQKVLTTDYPECLESQREDDEQRRSSREAFVKITLNFLRTIRQVELADRLQSKLYGAVCQHNLKSVLKKKFQCVFEGIAKAGNSTLLNQIYTELYITEQGTAEVNDEHEVRQIETASMYSGVFTQIFKEERGLYQDKVFCFIHLSVQEFLAALHVHLTFINSGVNLLEDQTTLKKYKFFNKPNLQSLHQSAVDKALLSSNGHLDLFLRFLLGLSLQTNQTLLRGLLTQTGSSTQTNKETVQYIKKKLSKNLSAEKSINLFHCLNELNDCSLVEEIQQSLSSGSLSTELSPAQWSALVFILLSSEKDLDVFDMKKYSTSEEALLKLLPVVKASNNAL